MEMIPDSSKVEGGYKEKNPKLAQERRDCCLGFPKRWLLVLLGFFGFVNVYAMRVNLSVAMVAMVKDEYQNADTQSKIACIELMKPKSNSSSNSGGDFDWNTQTQSMILGSFFYGYVITQIPGGVFAERYGAKWLFGIGVLITSIFTLVTPYAASLGVWPLAVVRAIEGLGEGVTFPAMMVLIGRWAPKNERSRMASIIFNGSCMGNVVSFALSGWISDTLGWPSVFYIFGALGTIWTVLWLLLVHDTPELHPCITEEEIEYIRRGKETSRVWSAPAVPWRDILTSRYVWALVIANIGYCWGFYTLLTELPTYLADILHFDIKRNGVLSSLPYLSQACISIAAGFIADGLRTSGRFKINTIRKGFSSIAFFGPALCIALVAFVGCQPTVIIVLLVISAGLNGCNNSGHNITQVDMSPEFSGTLMGITNGIGNLTGFLAPAYVGLIIKKGQTLNNWKIVFLTASGVYLVTGMVYNLFCTAEQQPWGTARSTEKKYDELDNDRNAVINDSS